MKVRRAQYNVGGECWFIDGAGRWFRCRVVARDGNSITIQSMTGLDANRTTPWPAEWADGLEISRTKSIYARLRPASAREP